MDEQQVAELVADHQRKAVKFIESGKNPKRRRISKTIRGIIYQSVGEKCSICDLILSEHTDTKSTKSYDPIDSSITIEHLFPLDLGGNNAPDNMVPMCYACNVKARCATQQHFVETMVKEKRGKTLSEEDKEILNRFVEWSIRTVKSPGNKIDSEIQQYFENVREILATGDTTLSPSISIGNLEKKIAVLEKKIQALENTFWKRIMRFIGSFFQRGKQPNSPKKASKTSNKPPSVSKSIDQVEKILSEKSPPPQEIGNRINPDFTPKEFSTALLNQKKKSKPEDFPMLYRNLIREEPSYNLSNYDISPNKYLLEKCSEFLLIEERSDGKTPPITHYWIGEIESFKSIITGIIADSEQKTSDGRTKLTISALGQRFSKRVQSLGFENKKEYFQQNGLDPSMSITKAISANFSEEEIELVGANISTGSELNTRLTHVVLNRRG